MKSYRQFSTVISITLLTGLLIFISGCGKEEEDKQQVEAHFDVVPANGTVSTTFSFDASGTKAKQIGPGIKIYCDWDFDNDGNFELENLPHDSIVTYQYSVPGNYEALLSASAAGGSDTYIRTIGVISDTNTTTDCYDNYHIFCPGQPTVSYGGQDYKTAQIGNQCWMAENLNVGQTVNSSTYPSDNDTIEKFCVNDVVGNCEEVGGLYTWKEAMNYSSDPQGICPPGWHIPTLADWDELANYLGGYGDEAAWKMMACEDDPWNLQEANNESGFTAFPTGYYWIWFDWETQRAYYWSSEAYDADRAYYKYLDFQQGFVGPTSDDVFDFKSNSMCIRCIRD